MVLYQGSRNCKGQTRVVRIDDGARSDLPPRLDLANHSPTGYEWSYGGSGPAQLALALLSDRLPDDANLAYELHQQFKWDCVCKWPKSGWVIDAWEIDQWIFSKLDAYEIVPAGGDADAVLVR